MEKIKRIEEKIKEIIKEIEDAYNVEDEGLIIGIRWDDAIANHGDIMPESRIWDDGEPTEYTLGATSAIDIYDFLKRPWKFHYCGDNAYVLLGKAAGTGEDDGEILIKYATVRGKVEKLTWEEKIALRGGS